MPASSYFSRADDAPSAPSAGLPFRAVSRAHSLPQRRSPSSWARAATFLALMASATLAQAGGEGLSAFRPLLDNAPLAPVAQNALAPQAAGAVSATQASMASAAPESSDCRADPTVLRAMPADSSDADKKRWLEQKPCLYTPARPAFARLNEFNIARPQSLALGDANGVSRKYDLLQPADISADAPQ